MEDIIGKWMFIWNETEKIEKSNEFITTKLIKILGLRGYLVENEYAITRKINPFKQIIVTTEYTSDTELNEIIIIDKKIKLIFNHNTYKCYLEYKEEKIEIKYKNVMDIVMFVNFAELLYSTDSEHKEKINGKNK
ncbi:hypothetical protein [Peptacetobacter sp. AB800]|uniref:hypothetical protein n=1 Tax=Peptacetobacter sp. AB800 TaxID=3388428 RepID=UPI0039FD8499